VTSSETDLYTQAWLDALISAARVGLALIDTDLRYLRANQAFAAFSDIPPGGMAGRTVRDSAPGLWPRIEQPLRRALDLGQSTYDYDLIQAVGDDKAIWRFSCFPLRVGDRIIAAGISVVDVRDLSSGAEPATAGTEDREEIQYTLDIDRHHPASPDRVFDLLGIQRGAFATYDGAFVNAVYRDKGAADGSALPDSDASLAIEHRLVGTDGAVRWVHKRTKFQVGSGGRQTLAGTVQHITGHSETENRLHQMQSELLHVSRLSAVGQVSSTLAHEVNQPLTAIGNYIRAGLLMLESSDPAVRAKSSGVFEKAAQQAARASEIVRNLREFARKGDSARQAENLTIVVQEAMALARLGTKDRGLKVRLRLDGESSWATVNRIQIQQVLVNLIRNAIEAMAESVRRELVVATASGGPDLIEVSVADSGPGLSDIIARELFKPFMTTKPEGMGVGLAICQTIIEAHGGKIWVEPNQQAGTIFRFTLQRSVAAAAPEDPNGY
jgi:signal transduction histidine kinase